MAGLLPQDHFSSRRSSGASGSRTPHTTNSRDPYRTPRQSFASSSSHHSSSRHGRSGEIDYNDPYYVGSDWGSQPSSRRSSSSSSTIRDLFTRSSGRSSSNRSSYDTYASPSPRDHHREVSPRRSSRSSRHSSRDWEPEPHSGWTHSSSNGLPPSNHFLSRRHWSQAEPSDPRPVGRASIFSTPPGSRRPSHSSSREYREPLAHLPDRRPSYFDRRNPSRDLGQGITERRPWR